MKVASSVCWFSATPVAAQAHVREEDVKRAHARGRGQSWMREYVDRANAGGIERVLV